MFVAAIIYDDPTYVKEYLDDWTDEEWDYILSQKNRVNNIVAKAYDDLYGV